MTPRFFLYALGVWIVLAVLAITNAIIREILFTPKFGDYRGHVISTITLVTIIFIITYIFLNFVSIDYTSTDLLILGGIWFVLTISFEFLAGHYVFGNSWKKLLHDYNILEGRVWILVLITTFIAPYVVGFLLEK